MTLTFSSFCDFISCINDLSWSRAAVLNSSSSYLASSSLPRNIFSMSAICYSRRLIVASRSLMDSNRRCVAVSFSMKRAFSASYCSWGTTACCGCLGLFVVFLVPLSPLVTVMTVLFRWSGDWVSASKVLSESPSFYNYSVMLYAWAPDAALELSAALGVTTFAKVTGGPTVLTLVRFCNLFVALSRMMVSSSIIFSW